MLSLEFGGSSTLGDGKASGNQNIAAVQNGWLWGLVPCHQTKYILLQNELRQF